MSNTIKKITAIITAFIIAAAVLVLIPPVNASAASIIDYSVSYSGKYVKLRFIPQNSSDTIYYTADNTKPTKSSAVYKMQLAAAEKTTVRALEYSKGGKLVASIKITITPRTQKPVITESVKDGRIMLTLRSATAGAAIYYTTDGSTPKKSSSKYSGAIEYKRGMNIKARAYASGFKASAISSYYLASDEYGALTGDKGGDDTVFADEGAPQALKDVVALVNKERESRGLTPLIMDPALDKAAAQRAEEVSGHFAHKRPDGSSNFTVLDEMNINYGYAGENIAGGQTSAAAVMNSWMNSTGHRTNILSKDYYKIGVGHYISGGMDYWVQVFTD